MGYTLKVYQTENGVKPLMDWLRGLKDQKVRTAIQLRLNRMELGNFGHCKSVGEGVSELKVDVGPGYRVYLSRIKETVILLLLGGSKSSQFRDIRKTKEFLNEDTTRQNEKR